MVIYELAEYTLIASVTVGILYKANIYSMESKQYEDRLSNVIEEFSLVKKSGLNKHEIELHGVKKFIKLFSERPEKINKIRKNGLIDILTNDLI